MAKEKGTLMHYKCQWCGHEFDRMAYYERGGFRDGKSFLNQKKKAYSSIIRCPKCQNLIPTWKKEKVEDAHGVGRQHIHPDR
jgi:hypothetical protein